MATKIIVNITSYTDIAAIGAEHYYAKAWKIESDENIYQIADKLNEMTFWSRDSEILSKTIDAKEAAYLSKKDGGGWHAGDTSDRFNSVEEIKVYVLTEYDTVNDIIFLRNDEVGHNSIFCRTKEEYKKTGRKIKIQNFEGFSPEFVELKEGSIHEVIETPERYVDKDLQSGVWVMGITEPVLVLTREYINVNA